MDLKSIINNEAGERSAARQAAPVTPVHTVPPQGFRDYPHPHPHNPHPNANPNLSHPPLASPGKHGSQDYASSQPGGPYASPTTYHANYPGRPPQPPPIQAPPQNDLRSPARSYSAQSPYQHTPSSSVSAGQYPFPPAHQTPQSPAQHHQYPPTFQQRESFPQSNPPPHLQQQQQQQNSHIQGSPAPQTPPIGMPGAPHPYLQHQRSQSSISTSTPTSAQSQPPYYNQFPQDSPVSAGPHPASQLPQHHRQQSQQSQQSQHSQPGTPLGPPLRQLSGGFNQPPSPYQQRGISAGPYTQFHQTSPAPPAPASIPRLPSTPSAYGSQRTSISEQHRRSQSERERSLSVSPKTRLPSQPRGEVPPPQPEQFHSASKRKMDDREMSIDEPRRHEQVNDIKPSMNGNHSIRSAPQSVSVSPKQPPKKRIRYVEPPIWAQSVRSRNNLAGGNRGPPRTNGKQPSSAGPPQVHSPVKIETNGSQVAPPAATRAEAVPASNPASLLGPWEQSITGIKPTEQMTKLVADFLYLHVISRNDLGELASRGVEIEIEAKLGQLINKDTNERFFIPAQSECVLAENARVGFRSSMTESQHKHLNGFLNSKVAETHPANPQTKRRVKIDYLHRREVDKFFELPPNMHTTLPAAVREQLNPRHSVKVRVTHDQKTNQVLAKIVKARIADLDIFMPQSPLDCRISINLELRYDGDIEDIIAQGIGERIPDRIKDRLSYTQGPYQIDLTQVTQVTSINGANRMDKEHELEIELATTSLKEQGRRATTGEPNEYLSLVEGMIDNVRVLARNVPHQ